MRPTNFYEWPEGLYPLREWLRAKLVDVGHIKSERQAFFMARTIGKQKVRFSNDRSVPLFPAMLKLQRSLCPGSRANTPPAAARKHIPGTFGAASAVRNIDPAEYLAEKARETDR